jgi:hypothetical protein
VGDLDRLLPLAIELERLPVDIFVAGGEALIQAAEQASDSIPTVAARCRRRHKRRRDVYSRRMRALGALVCRRGARTQREGALRGSVQCNRLSGCRRTTSLHPS